MPVGGFETLDDLRNTEVAGGVGSVESIGRCNSALPIDVLTRARGGTVESWEKTVSALPHLKLDDPSSLERWEPRARGKHHRLRGLFPACVCRLTGKTQ